MISEKVFISSFNSFWQDLIPYGEGFVRIINLTKRHYDIPIKSRISQNRRAIVNEVGYLLYKTSVTNNESVDKIFSSKKQMRQIYKLAVDQSKRFSTTKNEQNVRTNRAECIEGLEIAKRMQSYFHDSEKGLPITCAPRFSGCGFVDDCYGDVLTGNTLYEVKSGEQAFRLRDVRQILTYLALNQAGNLYPIQNIGFVNPRIGMYYKASLIELAWNVSGRDPIEVLSDIIRFTSCGELSR